MPAVLTNLYWRVRSRSSEPSTKGCGGGGVFRGCDKGQGSAGLEDGAEDARQIEVVAIVIAALHITPVDEVPVPDTCLGEVSGRERW